MSANLKGATLRGANLHCAVLTGADMTGAILNGAQMSGANFEPDVNPELRGISQATDLELVTYDDTPDALVQLSNDFRNGGYDEQARQVTFAKKRRDTQRLWKGCNLSQLFHNCAVALFNWVFFDLTCRYGMRPGLTLLCVGGMWGKKPFLQYFPPSLDLSAGEVALLLSKALPSSLHPNIPGSSANSPTPRLTLSSQPMQRRPPRLRCAASAPQSPGYPAARTPPVPLVS